MNPLAEACTHRPFSNGTEFSAWFESWCAYCTHDHGMTHHEGCGDGCPIILDQMVNVGPEWRWPEAWLPEPTGEFWLPSKLICGQFEPCTQQGCEGDPGADERAERVAEVTAYWMPTNGRSTDA